VIDEHQRQLLDRYLDLLLLANETMNLTSVTERPAAELLHIADALTLLPFLPPGKFSLADIGSGGGSPAFPLAIARPDAIVTCIESTKKKAAFLERAAAELALPNLRVFADRAESAPRRNFEVVTARAVGSLAHVAELALPLLRPRGRLLAMKGKRVAEELPAALKIIRRLGGDKPVLHPLDLPGTDSHVVVEIRNNRKAPL
jgi:16S rRNA (guanine527-N7)-methyltransferase